MVASVGHGADQRFQSQHDAATIEQAVTNGETIGNLNGLISSNGSNTFTAFNIGTEIQAFDSMLASLSDLSAPSVDRLLFWDYSTSSLSFLTLTPELEITTTSFGIDFTELTLSDFITEPANNVMFISSSGAVTFLGLGADGEYLMSNGASVAPTWETPPGGGDITSIGDCVTGACPADTALGNQSVSPTGPWDFSGASAFTYKAASITDADIDFTSVTLTDLIGPTWKMWYTNGTNINTALVMGSAGEYLQSNGVSAAPTWVTPPGGGDVTSVGSCLTGACPADAALDNEPLSPTGGVWDLSSLGSLTLGEVTYAVGDGLGSVEIDPLPNTTQNATGIITTVTVDTNTVGFGAVLVQGSDGNYDMADADSNITVGNLVMALEAGIGSKKVLRYGFVRDDAQWNFTTGGDLYVSTTAGNASNIIPSGTGDQIQCIGKAESADVVFFNPSAIYFGVQ